MTTIYGNCEVIHLIRPLFEFTRMGLKGAHSRVFQSCDIQSKDFQTCTRIVGIQCDQGNKLFILVRANHRKEMCRLKRNRKSTLL